MRAYEDALADFARGDAGSRHELARIEALWRLSLLQKRHGLNEEAARCWRALTGQHGPWSLRAHEELAKFLEHRARDLPGAQMVVEGALARLEGGRDGYRRRGSGGWSGALDTGLPSPTRPANISVGEHASEDVAATTSGTRRSPLAFLRAQVPLLEVVVSALLRRRAVAVAALFPSAALLLAIAAGTALFLAAAGELGPSRHPASTSTVSAAEVPPEVTPPATVPRERVELTFGADPESVRALIEELGGTVELESGGRLQVLVTTAARDALAASVGLGRLQEPLLVVPLQASSLSRGLLGVDRWRDAGFTGYGVKVAILDGGFRGYESRLGRTLPAQVVARSFRVGVAPEAGTDHGTLAAEVVYSIAPGAQIYLLSFGTLTELSAAVDFLIEEKIDVVSFSLGFLHSGAGDGTGPVNDIVGRGVSGGGAWSVAAGNWAREHWRGHYVDTNGDSVHEFALGLTGNRRFFQVGDLVSVSLRWDDAWGAACSDFDLELFAPSGSLVRASRRTQNCSGYPVEGLQVLATETGSYEVRIVGADVRAAHTLDLLIVGSPDRGESIDFVTPLGSLSEPADHPGVVSVGALGSGAPLGAAPFSSRGPTVDGRAKPEVLSPTGGVLPSGSAFAGTSAAAPHVAGVLALLREGLPTLPPQEVARELLVRSIDFGRGAPGAPEVLAGLGAVSGLGRLLPPGANQARYIGVPPRRGGRALLVYVGPTGYPTRFGHLLSPGQTPRAYFRFDQATQDFDRYIVGAPAQVQTFDVLTSGTAYVVRFAEQ
ncbi:MAG: hypothetical protein EXR66_04820 [Dehalococcoidia bacterium]|nr:hypothetical protein [Dehalococcoidia bacterium]